MSSSSWSCSRCTFLNPPAAHATSCQICLSPAPAPAPSPTPTPSSSSTSPPPTWTCKACTFLNSYASSNCAICDTPSSLSTIIGQDQQIDASDPSVGSVFFPLRSCSNPQSADLASSKRKLDKTDDPLFADDLSGFRGIKSARKQDTAEAVDGLSMKNHTGSVESSNGVSSIKILSYNVWFREDLYLDERMEAIGNLIHLHSPDIICLQEVTPNIFDIFRSSTWWKIYQCSVSRERAHSQSYFCMLLAKLPVKSVSQNRFRNSIMGRELSIVELEVKPEKLLVVATSHLESPCPAPPKWDQMFSKERIEQAKESISILKKHPNAVFCGDMNWDDQRDGQFPYPGGWTDAWASLRPAEKGFTYDTKSNMMLSGNRTLQKRLDRFICGLQDFKISGIEMVGMEEIPGLSHCKEKKSRNGIQKLMLPVLPSDHYGLLLTITNL